MLNIFLQREQESSRSDAVAFHRKAWSRLTPREAPRCPVTLTMTPSKDKSKQLRGKRVEGRRRRGRRRGKLRQLLCGKSTFQPFWGQVRSLPFVLHTRKHWDAHSAGAQVLLGVRQAWGQQCTDM